jgi:hypothetical protein
MGYRTSISSRWWVFAPATSPTVAESRNSCCNARNRLCDGWRSRLGFSSPSKGKLQNFNLRTDWKSFRFQHLPAKYAHTPLVGLGSSQDISKRHRSINTWFQRLRNDSLSRVACTRDHRGHSGKDKLSHVHANTMTEPFLHNNSTTCLMVTVL